MSQNFHTPYEDDVTEYKADDMNTPLGELDAAISQIGSAIYDVGGTFESKPSSSQILLRLPMPRIVNFSPGMPDSQMVAGIAATAQTIFSIRKDDVEFATATFAAAATVATFTSGAGASFIAGDVLTMVAPASQDATVANLGWCIAGGRTILTTTTTTTSSTTTSSFTSTSTTTTTSTSTSTSTSSTTTTTTTTTTA